MLRTSQRNYYLVFLIFLTFFVISLLTNIIGPLIPEIIQSFNLSLALAGFLPFAFFIAYGVMSIPAGFLVEKYREKKVMTTAFILALAGALLFALFPNYSIATMSLFLIGLGMAMLQVAINPLLRVSGGEEHFAFNSVMAQLIFGAASFLSPLLYSYLVTNLPLAEKQNLWLKSLRQLVPAHLPWVSLYWVFAAIALLMFLIIFSSRFPKVELTEEEKAGTWAIYKILLKKRAVLLYFFGIMAYVGTEQGLANWISQFLKTYHGLDPQTAGAQAVSYFWGLMTVGCLMGLVLLKLLDSKKVLVIFSILAIILLSLALFGPGELARWAFPLLGFSASVMWSIIFSLALNSVEAHQGAFSGLLCTGIVGGALVPLLIGWLGDHLGLRQAMFVLYLTLAYILSIGFWARPLISNETIWMKRKKKLAASQQLKADQL
ncbi:MAG: MFS transporter [Acidobacteriota bacterium]|nr:MFS transporter [Acidobacteriota bacterium]MDW3229231.1 MFS transporter [Acidobacteriota bacterium]MDY0231414.1 MFS transporter [Candidatus Saccharicenans sp.]